MRLVFLLLTFGIVAIWFGRRYYTRKRFWVTVKEMADFGDEIDGQPMEYWLAILNRDTNNHIFVYDSKAVSYKDKQFFVADSGISYLGVGMTPTYDLQRAFLLVAVNDASVNILADENNVFRQITGSGELAAFVIYRWAAFVDALRSNGKPF
jgi:hypothetical protein